jgi:hypothetical protein
LDESARGAGDVSTSDWSVKAHCRLGIDGTWSAKIWISISQL